MSPSPRRWSKDENYKAAYDDLDEEFQLARALIDARALTLQEADRILRS